ncbi:hypothetical protein B0T14DRAFT_513582 [Immersiella caudata]|uniref:C-type lectin domain-containing protein n=1 Tax=Immersiella caudata TaxID=314043 RepID=A0AA40C725_9PEZI|nr:hypothetical protein B0T14DRAFT_513582 [Immersiella caudata]
MVSLHLLSFTAIAALTVAQSPTPSPSPTTTGIFVVSTRLPYDAAVARCRELGANIYPVPLTPTDPVYDFVGSQPEGRYWIMRRGGRTCTCIRNIRDGSDVQLDEAICGDLNPAVCGSF